MSERRISGRQAVTLGGAVAVVVVVTVSVVGARHSSEGFPAWLEAASTFAAFAAASVAVFFAMGTQQIEAKRDHRIETALVREQASKVAGWYGLSPSGGAPTGTRSIRMQLGVRMPGVYVRNASDLPVSSVLVALTAEGRSVITTVLLGVLPPASDPKFEPFPVPVAAMIDNARNTFSWAGADWEPGVGLAFVDAAGVGWVRGPTGHLQSVSGELVAEGTHGSLWGLVGLSGPPLGEGFAR